MPTRKRDPEVVTITRGDRKPDVSFLVGDARGDADFRDLTVDAVTIEGEQNGNLIVRANPTSIEPSEDGHSAVVRRSWGIGETDRAGRVYFKVKIDWGGGVEQTFPANGSLFLDIRRAPGDG